jgi:hypothetical protein
MRMELGGGGGLLVESGGGTRKGSGSALLWVEEVGKKDSARVAPGGGVSVLDAKVLAQRFARGRRKTILSQVIV